MSKISRALSKWTKLKDIDLLAFFQAVLTAMINNENFTMPTPTLAVLTAATKLYSDSLTQARKGDKVAIAQKKIDQKAAKALFQELQTYINYASNGNRAKILSSAYPVNAEVAVPFVLKKPQLKIYDGPNDGQLIATAKGNSSLINFYMTTTPNDANSWIRVANKAGTAYLNDLQSGTRYYVRAEALGSRGQRKLSDIVSRVSQ